MSTITSYFTPITQNRFINPLLTLKYGKETALVAGILGSACFCVSRLIDLKRQHVDWTAKAHALLGDPAVATDHGVIGRLEGLLKNDRLTMGNVLDFRNGIPPDFRRTPEIRALDTVLLNDEAFTTQKGVLGNRKAMAREAIDYLLFSFKRDYRNSLIDEIRTKLAHLKEVVEGSTVLDTDTSTRTGRPFKDSFQVLAGLEKIASETVEEKDLSEDDATLIGSLAAHLPSDFTSAQKINKLHSLSGWVNNALRDTHVTIEGETKSVSAWFHRALSPYEPAALPYDIEVSEETTKALSNLKGQLQARAQQPSWGWMDVAQCLTPVALGAGFYTLSSFATMPVNG